MKWFWIYLIIVNIIAAGVCTYDKIQARRHGWRIPEKHLFLWSIIGGSVGMYATMQLIRHKTKHLRFMIGIPLIIVVQIVLILKFVIGG